MKTTKKTVLTYLSCAFTVYGIGAFIIGLFIFDWIEIGLLAMILGEVIDTED